MASQQLSLREARLRLLWSLWTEMGVAGAHHAHTHVAVDPEWLVLCTPWLASTDPRLLEMSFAWCAQHGEVALQRKRLKGLEKVLSPAVRKAFAPVADRLTAHASQLWGPVRGRRVDAHSTDMRRVALRTERPAMAMVRARLLFGMSARPDVLCAFLARPEALFTADDVSQLGFSRRTVGRVLSELAASGVLDARSDGYRHTFRLKNPAALVTLLGAQGVQWRPWELLFPLLVESARLDEPPSPGELGRVVAAQVREAVLPSVHQLVIDGPPEVAGRPTAFEDMQQWATKVVNTMAAGNVPTRRA